MNVYVVVEGRVVEKVVYTSWIPQINEELQPATYFDEVASNNFYIVSGNGYPAYLEIISNALEDVHNDSKFDRLVICVDSEEMSLVEKQDEICRHVASIRSERDYRHVDCRVVIQHFCFETWALGNRTIGSRNPKNETLRRYRRIHNVITHDPEDLPALPEEALTRSQFAEKYLRLMLNDKNKNLTYSKNNPRVVAHPKYFAQLCRRLNETQHIRSFQAFVDAFV